MTNLSMTSKNRPKNRTQPEIKNQPELGSIFHELSKYKNT
jgi:hypothetical protein